MIKKPIITEEWFELLKDELAKPYMFELMKLLDGETKFYPSEDKIFEAYNRTAPSDVKVVIIGQDPYPSEHAHGLAFSSLQPTIPKSLKTIFSEIKRTHPGIELETSNLSSWADQGVFLLNSILTVRPKKPLSHSLIGWQEFTKKTIDILFELKQPIVFLVWGKKTQEFFGKRKETSTKAILYADHPATAAYGRDRFSGCDHFNLTNRFLKLHGVTPISWELTKTHVTV